MNREPEENREQLERTDAELHRLLAGDEPAPSDLHARIMAHVAPAMQARAAAAPAARPARRRPARIVTLAGGLGLAAACAALVFVLTPGETPRQQPAPRVEPAPPAAPVRLNIPNPQIAFEMPPVHRALEPLGREVQATGELLGRQLLSALETYERLATEAEG
ncbi:MAG: hypothetical protein KF858_09420 [Candidatus Sumerlaeia bacterium]|nr:hypothetical protein [Candidatus Sumerlaeia bacterium]